MTRCEVEGCFLLHYAASSKRLFLTYLMKRAHQALLSANELLDAILKSHTLKKGLMNDPISSPSTLIQLLVKKMQGINLFKIE